MINESKPIGRLVFVAVVVVCMILAIGLMLSPRPVINEEGRYDLSTFDVTNGQSVTLDGQWEFYWDRLLTPGDLEAPVKPMMDGHIKVPSSWEDARANPQAYPRLGVATYRLSIIGTEGLNDPALLIKPIYSAYKLYVNGEVVAAVGNVSDNLSDFVEGVRPIIVDLPKGQQTLELVFQVANLRYARGGMRVSPVFGSHALLTHQWEILTALQLLFIGAVLIFSVYYFILFISQTQNKTALIFSLFCFVTAFRSLIWGAAPIQIFFPDISYDALAFINYATGYNLIPLMVLFVASIFPLDQSKKSLLMVLLPTLIFDGLLLTSPAFMSRFTNYLYPLILLQLIYAMVIVIKAVMRQRDNAMLMLIAVSIYFLTINQDILNYKGIGSLNVSHMFLYGGLAVIIAMSYVQAKLQARTHEQLILYNVNLLEASRLKDKIMDTEMSFLQAQIKPHFLYNALDAIANVCEEDGDRASSLIVDLSIYLRGSLAFNSLDKRVRIDKELEFVDTYFNIEQARFGPKIQLIKEIDIPLDCLIPVLILQPLVENAVRHSLSKKVQGGQVTIRGSETEDKICIEIEDDGIGIEPEKLMLLLNEEREDLGVGLLNIHNRLLKTYGSGLDIRSQMGVGTCVKLELPKERMI